MANYEYILASLPEITSDSTGVSDAESVIGEIRSQLDGKDLTEMLLLDSYFSEEGPGKEFYLKARASGCRFIREYFEYDRTVRNAKVTYLNGRLGRPEGTDILLLGEEEELPSCPEAEDALGRTDLIEREKALDDLMWAKADELTCLDILDLDLIIAFIIKLKIADRWMKLDAEKGRALLRKLVDEIRNSNRI